MNDPGKDYWSTGRALVLSFAAVAIVFTLSTIAEQTFSSRIRSAAEEITGNSSPSISSLSSMRGSLRRLEVALTDEMESCTRGQCPHLTPSGDTSLRSLRETWNAYRLLPTFPGEAERWPEVDAALGRLEAQVTRALTAAQDGRASLARSLLDDSVKPTCDRLDQSLAELSEFDRAQGVAVAARINRLARLSIWTSVALDALSVALTVLAALLAIRVARRFERSMRERSDDLERFAGRVAHDIMSPLANTAAAIHLARDHTTGPGTSALEIGQRAVRRVQRLVDDLLEFARAGGPVSRNTSADVRETIEDVVAELQPIAADRHVAVRLVGPCTGTIACTTGVLTSILSNLVRNAIAYMGESPVREVVVRSLYLDDARAVRVEVEDTGPGIPLDVGESIFEPFVRGPTTGEPGTGLGLATAKRFVSAHGGRIGYRSRPGSGAVFWFEMPSGIASHGRA